MAVVGYDNSAFGGKGGFKVVNSWGSDWGNGGFAYLSYQFVMAYAFDIYVMNDRIGYQPAGIAHFQLSHPFWGWKYDNVTVSVGVGPTDGPLWSKIFLTGLERSSLTVDMPVDVTEGASYLPSNWTNRWWIKIEDHSTGDVGDLTAFDIQSGGASQSAQVVMPLIGPFFGGVLYAYIPAGEAASNDYYVNDDTVQGDVYCAAPGNDANDGLTPDTPKRTVQAIIDRYTLKAGDIVWIDAGVYNIASDIILTQLDRGTSGNPVRFVGAIGANGETATVFDRGGTSGCCFQLNGGAKGIQLENMVLSHGANGVYYDGSWAYGGDHLTLENVRITGSASYACSLYEAEDVRLDHSILSGFSGDYGIYASRSTANLNACVVPAPALS